MFDVLIIGGGVSGCCIARELSKTQRRIGLLEAQPDICEGTSKANSGIAHAGFDAKPGTLMAKLNVRGNQLLDELALKLDIPLKRNGALVLCFEEEGLAKLQELYDRGVTNGVGELQLLSGEEARALEPALSEEVKGALYAKRSGIVCPFGLTIAMAENAAENGVEFYRGYRVSAVHLNESGTYSVSCENGESFETKILINAAGVYSDVIHNMLPEKEGHNHLEIVPRRGEYCLYDKQAGNLVERTIFQLPGVYGKGTLVTPTVHGNLLIGPTAEDVPGKEDVNTTKAGTDLLLSNGARSVKTLPGGKQMITSFAGLRAHHADHDFIIEESKGYPGFVDVAAIESPGLTSAPAIGEYVAAIVQDIKPAPMKPDFKDTRAGIVTTEGKTLAEKKAIVAENPAYANIICRCESISEGEILAAIHRPVGATTVDGVKRRTRAGMGRCQGGFCSPKVTAILARELGIPVEGVRKSGEASVILYGGLK